MPAARSLILIALVAGLIGLAAAERVRAQALGGAPAYARTIDRAPYQSRARAYSAPRSRGTRQPGFFGRLFGYTPAPRRSNPYGGYTTYGWSAPYSARGYRTLCVRLCDGYYWPISFSARRSGLRNDAARCENSCSTPARLFYERSPGGNAQYMVDLKGKRYSELANAFRYREEYVEDCRCKPEPWSAEARAEYEARADQHVAEAAVKPEDAASTAAANAPAARQAAPATRRYTRRRPRQQRRPSRVRGGAFSARW